MAMDGQLLPRQERSSQTRNHGTTPPYGRELPPGRTRKGKLIRIGVTQLVDECTESRPIAPEYGQDGTCAARPISSISCTKTAQLRNSYSTCLTPKPLFP